jgi:hypothetical protein
LFLLLLGDRTGLINFAILVPIWLTIAMNSLYSGRMGAPGAVSPAAPSSDGPAPSDAAPATGARSPGRIVWGSVRWTLPYVLGVALSFAIGSPFVVVVEGDPTETAKRNRRFRSMGNLVFIIGVTIGIRKITRGARPLLPRTFARTLGRFFLGMFVIFVPLVILRVVQQIFVLDSDLKKAAAALVLWPLVRETSAIAVRKASFELSGHNHSADQIFMMVIHGFGSLVTRFLVNNMQTLEGTISLIISQALLEIILRQTITIRDRFAYVHLLRHSSADADSRFGSAKYGRNRARVVIAEMVSARQRRVKKPSLSPT